MYCNNAAVIGNRSTFSHYSSSSIFQIHTSAFYVCALSHYQIQVTNSYAYR